MVQGLEHAIQSYGDAALKRVLWKFRVNAKTRIVMLNFFDKVMDSGKGKIYRAFQRWASMPERDDSEQINATN